MLFYLKQAGIFNAVKKEKILNSGSYVGAGGLAPSTISLPWRLWDSVRPVASGPAMSSGCPNSFMNGLIIKANMLEGTL